MTHQPSSQSTDPLSDEDEDENNSEIGNSPDLKGTHHTNIFVFQKIVVNAISRFLNLDQSPIKGLVILQSIL